MDYVSDFFRHFGRYLLLLRSTLIRPEKLSIYWRETARQMVEVGYGSLPIVFIISIFLGAVLTVQTAFQITNPLFSKSIIGSIVANSSILEMAPTVTCLILAGKIGSSIASEIGTMRISEQIDALEMMGVSASAYLILPKIIASIIMVPVLIIISGFLCVFSGMWVGDITGAVTMDEFKFGMIRDFISFSVPFALIKAFTFGFIISSVSSYFGFYTEGGSLEVGKTSTKAIVVCCILILLADYLLSQLLLN